MMGTVRLDHGAELGIRRFSLARLEAKGRARLARDVC
jgi:hypothetical protein